MENYSVRIGKVVLGEFSNRHLAELFVGALLIRGNTRLDEIRIWKNS